jgi:hypothetical protein
MARKDVKTISFMRKKIDLISAVKLNTESEAGFCFKLMIDGLKFRLLNMSVEREILHRLPLMNIEQVTSLYKKYRDKTGKEIDELIHADNENEKK